MCGRQRGPFLAEGEGEPGAAGAGAEAAAGNFCQGGGSERCALVAPPRLCGGAAAPGGLAVGSCQQPRERGKGCGRAPGRLFVARNGRAKYPFRCWPGDRRIRQEWSRFYLFILLLVHCSLNAEMGLLRPREIWN